MGASGAGGVTWHGEAALDPWFFWGVAVVQCLHTLGKNTTSMDHGSDEAAVAEIIYVYIEFLKSNYVSHNLCERVGLVILTIYIYIYII